MGAEWLGRFALNRRVRLDPTMAVAVETLHKPLLVCKTQHGVEGTVFSDGHLTTEYQAFGA